MGLEEIIKNIELDTKARVKQIDDDALVASRKIEEEAEDKANEFLDGQKEKAKNDASQFLARELSRANIEAKGLYQKALNGAINDSFSILSDSMGEYTQNSDYQKLLGKLAAAAIAELGNDCKIFLCKKDIGKLKISATVIESEEDFVGGVRTESKDGKRYIDFSIGKIIDSLRDMMAVKVMDLIKE